ncbi:MAG: Ig-like domain-containing protein [Bacillota bacterium]
MGYDGLKRKPAHPAHRRIKAAIEALESRCLLSTAGPVMDFDVPQSSAVMLPADITATTLVATTTSLAVSSTSLTIGQDVTFTATVVSSDGSIPTGAVAFLESDAGSYVVADAASNILARGRLLGVVNLSPEGTASLACHTLTAEPTADPARSPLLAWGSLLQNPVEPPAPAKIAPIAPGQFGANLYHGTHNVIAVYLGQGRLVEGIGTTPDEILNLTPGSSFERARVGHGYLVYPNGLPLRVTITGDSLIFSGADDAPGAAFPGQTENALPLWLGLDYRQSYDFAATDTPWFISEGYSDRLAPPVLTPPVLKVTPAEQFLGTDTTHQSSTSATASVNVKLVAPVLLALQNTLTPTSIPVLVSSLWEPDGTAFIRSSSPSSIPVEVPGSIQSDSAQLTIDIPAPPPPPGYGIAGGFGAGFAGLHQVGIWGRNPFFPPPRIEPIPMPTGTITFYADDELLATISLNEQGQAVFVGAKPLGPLGSYTLRAVYSGDDHFAPAECTQTVTVTRAPTVTSISASTSTITQGDSTTVTVTVSTFDKDFVKPSGTVTILDDGNALATLILGTPAQSLSLDLPPGTHTLSASYSGDANCGLSASTALYLTVQNAYPNPPEPQTPGQAPLPVPNDHPKDSAGKTITKLRLARYGAATKGNAPTFAVTLFSANDELLSRGPWASEVFDDLRVASVTVQLPANGKPARGAQVGTLGSSLPLAVRGPSWNHPPGIPSGTAKFYDGKTYLGQGSLDNDGVAVFTPRKPLRVGRHKITASYEGDNDFAPAASASLKLNVTEKAATKTIIRLYGDKNPVLTAAIQTTSLFLTGKLTIASNGKILARYVLGADNERMLLNLPRGKRTLTVTYSGDRNCQPSSATVTVMVP